MEIKLYRSGQQDANCIVKFNKHKKYPKQKQNNKKYQINKKTSNFF